MSVSAPQQSTVLIVDDNVQNVALLDATLVAAGYDTLQAFSGEEALEAVKEHSAHLILFDAMMAKVDGYEVCRILKEQPQSRLTPIIMVTETEFVDDRINAIESGADDFLTKPVNNLKLLTRVKSLLRMRHLRDEFDRRQEEEKKRMKEIFKAYISDEIANLVLSDPDRFLRLGGEKRIVTVLFADLRGFTIFAGRYPAETVVNVLNQFFQRMTRIIFDYRGTLDKFIGDSIMAYFGAPISHDDDVLRSVQAAIAMQEEIKVLQQRWKEEDLPTLGLGVGISTGEVIFGNVGSKHLMNYTIIGDTVNVAQRLEETAANGQILISDATYQVVKNQVQVANLPSLILRGKDKPLVPYVLKGLKAKNATANSNRSEPRNTWRYSCNAVHDDNNRQSD